ncbi:MAG: SCO6880 family protein, partial [Acidimicrobiales bacterium]
CPPCAVAWPWPMAVETEWSCLRTDGTWHATYWVAEWPRVDVGPDFLGPLLLGSTRRTVSVVMEPLSPVRAVRQAEQARTADLADAELRRRGGFLSTARRAKEAELAGRREEELADGHASVRFSGYVTVTAPDRQLLAAACEATEQAAGQCRLELRRLYGDQERAFAYSLPLARGLS